MSYHLHTQDAPPLVEDPRTQWRRRLQQCRCLVCGARQLVHGGKSYFCAAHFGRWRWCATCETLRVADEHGKDSRCKGCATARGTATYHDNRDRSLYRHRLRQIASRQHSMADLIFQSMRSRIALADLVAQTPGWSWPRRAQLLGMNKTYLAGAYRRQCAGDVRDPDAATADRR